MPSCQPSQPFLVSRLGGPGYNQQPSGIGPRTWPRLQSGNRRSSWGGRGPGKERLFDLRGICKSGFSGSAAGFSPEPTPYGTTMKLEGGRGNAICASRRSPFRGEEHRGRVLENGTLPQSPIDTLFDPLQEPLAIHRPGLDHPMRKANIGHISLPAGLKKNPVRIQPHAVQDDAVKTREILVDPIPQARREAVATREGQR